MQLKPIAITPPHILQKNSAPTVEHDALIRDAVFFQHGDEFFRLFKGALALVGGIYLEFEVEQNLLVCGEREKLFRRGDSFFPIVLRKLYARRKRAQFFERMIAHKSRAVRRTLQRVIVNEHQTPVFGKMKIRLYHIHAAFERVTEGCHRIFGDDRAFAAMPRKNDLVGKLLHLLPPVKKIPW